MWKDHQKTFSNTRCKLQRRKGSKFAFTGGLCVLCNKPHEKRPIRRKIAIFQEESKIAIFCKLTKGGPRKNLPKWPTFSANFGMLENRKDESYNILNSMDWKTNYQKIVPCKKPHEKRPIKREIAIFPKWPIFWANFGRLEKGKCESYNSLISMDWKLSYQIYCAVQKNAWKKTYSREIAIFPKVPKMAFPCKLRKGGKRKNFPKWPILWTNFGTLENRKYDSYNNLISMDWKLNYQKIVLCKKTHEKRPIRREIAIFPDVPKMAVFLQISKGGTKEKSSKMADFFGKLRNARK